MFVSRNWAVVARTLLFAAALQASATLASADDHAPSSGSIDERVEQLLAKMTLAEKIGQLELRSWLPPDAEVFADPQKVQQFAVASKQAVREGRIGGFLHVQSHPMLPGASAELQDIAVKESRLGIPLLFGYDVIHGFRTVFPIPLGQAASWNADVIERGARVAAIEASSEGINWTFAPMIDIARDARWGRIAESLGEDVHLNSVLTQAMVRGFQGDDLTAATSLAATPKHFAAYGAAEGGRDYNASYMAETVLRDVYLPPFKAAVDAGAVSIMTSYHNLNGIPATGDRQLLTDILRGEWGFDGFAVSDWQSVEGMVKHGYAKDAAHAAELGINAGADFEMTSTVYEKHLAELIEQGRVDIKTVDESVRRMLRAKLRMGLFERPHKDSAHKDQTLSAGHLASARDAAAESFVLLKNDKSLLPLRKKQKVAIIGPLAEAPYQQLGTWNLAGSKKDSRTLLPALREYLGGDAGFAYAPGLAYSRDKDTAMFDEALALAAKSDVIVFFGGEEAILSGEGHSRGDISLPGAQQQLFHKLAALGKPIALVILAGRPISLEGIVDKADAVMMAWHPGTMAGPALVDVLYGERAPAGHLPVTWPKASAQIPIYYDHTITSHEPTDDNYTRMDKIDPALEVFWATGFSSNYLDYGHRPEFPFGFGLSYTEFAYSKLRGIKKKYGPNDTIEVSVRVKNTGKRAGRDVVQLYVRDLVASLIQPMAELKAFKLVELRPGRSAKVRLSVPVKELGFHNSEMKYVVEPGKFELWVGQDSTDKSLLTSFEVVAE